MVPVAKETIICACSLFQLWLSENVNHVRASGKKKTERVDKCVGTNSICVHAV